MKIFLEKWGVWAAAVFAVLCLLAPLGRNVSLPHPDLAQWGSLPVVLHGRTKPLDTVARTSLLVIHGRQSLKNEDGPAFGPLDWLAEVVYDSTKADRRKVFLIHDPEVLNVIGKTPGSGNYYAFADLEPRLEEIEKQARMAEGVEAPLRSRYQRHLLQLYNNLRLYQGLKNSLVLEGSMDSWSDLEAYRAEVARARHGEGVAGGPHLRTELGRHTAHYLAMAALGHFFTLPPVEKDGPWLKTGEGYLLAMRSEDHQVHPLLPVYVRQAEAYQKRDAAAFARATQEACAFWEAGHGELLEKTRGEVFFNRLNLFPGSMVLYVLVFFLACFSWVGSLQACNRAAWGVLLVAFLAHSLGLFWRMVLEGRPPVTNLYSSAIFIGWGAVLLAVALERLHRNGIGSATAGALGFMTLLVAHHLSLGGDTMEMMRAVLDSNFWLATHVVVITAGYAATFLAGFLAILFIIRGVATRNLDAATGKSFESMVYGILCFALLFSFIGTVLGGIWADQSWGRFWGWDPKENGALLIVLWNALILHARWGGLARRRGIMMMAVFGNVVTSWSWFGTNMLGVGLHSYGFIDKAFLWLAAFMISQLLIIAAACLPSSRWKSPAAL
jgi:ABC-type transport system involved in cytochrome c biogenesis permease subunit